MHVLQQCRMLLYFQFVLVNRGRLLQCRVGSPLGRVCLCTHERTATPNGEFVRMDLVKPPKKDTQARHPRWGVELDFKFVTRNADIVCVASILLLMHDCWNLA